jgi:ATP-dependent phosphofructokinase / diphosphate-dependent phosphofructokinase
VLASRLGVAAIDAANDGSWGMMPALKGQAIELVPMGEAVKDLRTVPDDEYRVAEVFFG